MMKKMNLKHERLDLTGGNCLKLVFMYTHIGTKQMEE